jgi:hypothetical protein
MPTAYPYIVELRLSNENTREQKLESRRVYAYSVTDACMQAIMEAAVSAGSAKIDVVKVGPPEECYAREALAAIGDTVSRAMAKVSK